MAVFTEKRSSAVDGNVVHEEACDGLSVHCFLGQIACCVCIVYFPCWVYHAAYSGIDASDDADAVFDTSEYCYGGSLCQFGAWVDLLVLVSYVPAVIANIDEPVGCFGVVSVDNKFSGYFRVRVLIADDRPEMPGTVVVLHFKDRIVRSFCQVVDVSVRA